MEVLFWFSFLLIPIASRGDPASCSKVDVMQRASSSAGGRWYLMAVKKREMMNQMNTQTKHTECSGFSSEPPCSCTVYDFNSAIAEPYIPEYNLTAYSYNMMSGKYDVQYSNMKLVDNSSNMAIFEVTSPGRENMNNNVVVRVLATDEHQSFMLIHVCMGEDLGTDVWFLSRSPSPSDYTVQEMNQALARHNITMEDMKKVMQNDCVYPPTQAPRNWSDKFRVF